MSNPAFAVEGSLELSVRVAEGRIADLSIVNRRPLSIAAAFTGQSAEAAVNLCARLFSICRTAQGLASAQAVEQACGFKPSAMQSRARELLLLAETVLENTGRSLLVWPELAGVPLRLPELKSLRAALADIHLALYPDGDWARPGGGRLVPDHPQLTRRLAQASQLVRDAVFGGEPILDVAAWDGWVARDDLTGPAMARSISSRGWERCGASQVPVLPDIATAMLNCRLSADDGSFVALPTWEGSPRITGPYARYVDHPLVASLGGGLLSRLAARLVELTQALRRLQDLVHSLEEDYGEHLASASGVGLGVVEAARGRLVHRVELRDGTVSRYQILAPTEWNFHPDGAFRQGVLGLAAGDEPQLLLRHLVAAFDPCVACKIEVA